MEQSTIDIGARIRRARAERGLTRRNISEETKLSPMTVAAIEANEFDRLPGGMFRAAYVRMVAAAVGLDPEELARAYRAAFETEAATPPPVPVRVSSQRRWMSLALVAGVLIAAVWLLPGDEAVPGDEYLEASHLWSQLSDLPVAVAEASEVVPRRPEFNSARASLQLNLRINAVCWVHVVADGERLIYELMRPGEQTVIEARDSIVLRVGNAGAVAYSVNGVAGRSLGGDGEVATVRITKDGTSDVPIERVL